MLKIFKSSPNSGCKRLAAVAGFARREDGAAALEFAIVAAPFIALLLATVQTTLAFFAGQVLESAVADSSRAILTGSAQNASLSQSAFAAAVCAASKTALFDCSKLMVDVQTGSEKLRDRARRIIMIVVGMEYEEADKLLRRAHWNVKAAIVMQKAGLSHPQALSRLRRARLVQFVVRQIALDIHREAEKGG